MPARRRPEALDVHLLGHDHAEGVLVALDVPAGAREEVDDRRLVCSPPGRRGHEDEGGEEGAAEGDGHDGTGASPTTASTALSTKLLTRLFLTAS